MFREKMIMTGAMSVAALFGFAFAQYTHQPPNIPKLCIAQKDTSEDMSQLQVSHKEGSDDALQETRAVKSHLISNSTPNLMDSTLVAAHPKPKQPLKPKPPIPDRSEPLVHAMKRLFAKVDKSDTIPEALLQELQQRVKNEDITLDDITELVSSEKLSDNAQYLLAELIASKKDGSGVNLAMELMQNQDSKMSSVGVELASSLVMQGHVAEILGDITTNSFDPDASDDVAQVIMNVSSAPMDEQQKSQVVDMLSNYVDDSQGELKSAALESLSELVSNDSQKVIDLFDSFKNDPNESVRRSAVNSLYNLKPQQFDADVKNKLKAIANNSKESLSVRGNAMLLLANYANNPDLNS
jgi:hypothetical protein